MFTRHAFADTHVFPLFFACGPLRNLLDIQAQMGKGKSTGGE